jgi:hypothetical protein
MGCAAMEPDWVSKLREKGIYLSEWLERYKQMTEIAPVVQRTLDYTTWQLRTIEARPILIGAPSLPDLSRSTELDLKNLKQGLPQPWVYNASAVASAGSLTSTGTMAILEYTQGFAELSEPSARQYAQEAKTSLERLDRSYGADAQVEKHIQTFRSDSLTDRFSAVRGALDAYRTGTGDKTAAGIAMRNLLEGVRGELWSRARTHQGENMTWPLMAERLASGPPDGTAYAALLLLESVVSSLIGKLSALAKDRERATNIDPTSLWMEVENLISAIVGHLRSFS